jgi:hypothetical protein
VFMQFFIVFRIVFVLELLANVQVEKRVLFPFNVLGFDDFVQSRVSVIR